MDRLLGVLQHYDWGDPAFIAALQSRPPSGLPEAELWLGAHPRAPSRLEGSGATLLDAIAADPVAALGADVAAAYGELPFLVKILAAAQPLSIQTHPSRGQAQLGFERETSDGVPRDATTRVYRDSNHKPELICALTPFEAKCGFRPLEATRELFDELGDAVARVSERLDTGGSETEVLHQVTTWLLQLDDDDARVLVDATVAASNESASTHRRELTWSAEIARIHPGDIGVVVALLLNHVCLQPGEALFLGAGNLHAYLRGSGVEVMANSDNVIRGGLTHKHVDVEELLAVVDCSPVDVPVQKSIGSVHAFDVPVADFDLERRVVDGSAVVEVTGPEILVVTDGRVRLCGITGEELVLRTGESAWVPASTGGYELAGWGTMFRCSTPPLGH